MKPGPAGGANRRSGQVLNDQRSPGIAPGELDGLGMIRFMGTSLPVIACSLDANGYRKRLDEWKSLLASAEAREDLEGGVRFLFRSDRTERVRALAAAEHECCSFLRFGLAEANDSLVLTVETDENNADALRFIFG